MKMHGWLIVAGLCLSALVSARAEAFSVDAASGVADVPAALSIGDVIDLSLPGGRAMSLAVVASPSPGLAGRSFIAGDSATGASAIIKPGAAGAMRIMVDDFANGKIYGIRIADGAATVSVQEKSETPDECATCAGCGAAHVEADEPAAAARPGVKTLRKAAALRSSGSAFPVAEQKSVIDILVLFDKGAKTWAENAANWGGGDSVEEFADYAVDKMNAVLANSQLDDQFEYRLVGVMDVDASFSGVTEALGSVRSRTGAFSKVHDMQRACGADTTVLLINRTEGTSSGVSYSLGKSIDDASVAQMATGNLCYSVCDIKTTHSMHTMSHEIGHQMGAGHSNLNTTGGYASPQTTEYSFGYHFKDAGGKRFRTVMGYVSAGGYSWDAAPYFSSPDITPAQYGVAVGTPTNDNRRVLAQTHRAAGNWHEHVVPYEWDVRFLDGDGNDIPDGSYFSNETYVTLHCAYEGVDRIYYTLDGSTPNGDSPSCSPGYAVPLVSYDSGAQKTITACAVANGTALSVRTITLTESSVWSGESGMRGNGTWINGERSVLAWNDSSRFFYTGDGVAFPDLAENAAPTVTVKGAVSPGAASFPAWNSAYTFAQGDAASLISLPDAVFAPSGDLTFDVPVALSPTNFKVASRHCIAFNAPFGTNVTAGATVARCPSAIGIGEYGKLVVAPGQGKTQVFDKFDTGWYYSSAEFRVGEGTVVFKGSYDSGRGVMGSPKISVGPGGHLVFDVAAATGFDVKSTMTVEKGGDVTFNSSMEHMERNLVLAGGAIYVRNRFDRMDGQRIVVTDDSSINDMGDGSGYLLIRRANETVDVAAGKSFALNIPTESGANTTGFGIVKTGDGEFVANRELRHPGPTIVSNGTFTVGYSSLDEMGTGWVVADGASLRLKEGASLSVPSLDLAPGAVLEVPVASSAPLTVANSVDVSGLVLKLGGSPSPENGASYPILSSKNGVSGDANVNTQSLPALADGLKWEVSVSGGTLFANVAAALVLDIPRGETCRLEDVGPLVASITGEGTLLCGATLPDAKYGFADSAWKGTVAFEGLNYETATQKFQFELYGNKESTIRLTDCRIQYLRDNNATFAGTLLLDGGTAFCTRDGYSSTYNVFGALEGTGSMSFTGKPKQGYVFNVATNFYGSMEVAAALNGSVMEGRRVVFGEISEASGLPSQSATITVKAGAEASIGSNATWNAHHGVEVAGTLIVKGAWSTLDCNDGAAMGLELADGSTLRFDAADAKLTFAKAPHLAAGATSHVAFAAGVSPHAGMVLAAWPEGAAPAGEFAFADAEVSKDWALSKTATGLVVKRAPLPDNVSARITVRHWNGSAYVDEALPFDLPTGWVTNYFPSLDSRDAVAAKYGETAANGAAVWQCYMLGLDPTNAESRVSLAMTVVGGKLRFAVEGLGETHEIAGISVSWSLKTSTDLASDPGFSNSREYKTGLPPIFDEHPIPDVPKMGAQTVDTLFYKVTATFVADDGGN